MAETSSILLKNATILVPSQDAHRTVEALREHSLLIEGNKIARIAKSLDPSPGTEVIDCTGKIVSPGFIDTHHHVWQTQLKGRHADHCLLEYAPTGNMQSYNYTPEDIFWGELGGHLEAINAGTTTIVDHAHMNYSPENNTSAIAATVSSGIRSIFCYAPTARVATWEPTLTMNHAILPDWSVEQAEELAKNGPYGDGRVNIGLAFDAFFLPQDVVADLYKRCRQAGTKLITTHYARGAVFGQHSLIDVIDSYGLLGSDTLISHANNLTASDAKKLNEAHASISSTPETEMQMALGEPVCFQEAVTGISSIGIDCHSNNGSSIISQVRLGLQAERARRNDVIIQAQKAPTTLDTSVHDAFRLATIQGAKAIGMQDKVGSLEEGKMADILIFDGLSPGMVCAAQEDPVAAILLHSSIADISDVIVDGQFRKRDGKLARVALGTTITGAKPEKPFMEWPEIVSELLQSRDRVIQAQNKSWSGDLKKAVKDVAEAFYIPDENLV